MTTFDRFERAIPELMDELAPARVPDYFDDMLRQTARSPAARLELPRKVASHGHRGPAAHVARLPWRPLLVAAADRPPGRRGSRVVYRLAAATAAPFGLARNGQILFSTPEGKIVSADPDTGAITALITGPDLAFEPLLQKRRHPIRVRPANGGQPCWLVRRERRWARQRCARPAADPRSGDLMVRLVADGRPLRPLPCR